MQFTPLFKKNFYKNLILHYFLLIHTIFRYDLHSLKNAYDIKSNLLSTKINIYIRYSCIWSFDPFNICTYIWIPFKSFDLLQSFIAFVLDWVEFKLKWVLRLWAPSKNFKNEFWGFNINFAVMTIISYSGPNAHIADFL